MNRILGASLLIGGLCACDVQPNGKYEGEPLLVLGGAVDNQLSTTPARIDVVLWWAASGWSVGPDGAPPPGFVPFSDVAVTGTFPSDFQLDVFVPPPSGSIFDFAMPADQGDPMALGFIAALDMDANRIVGMVLAYNVIYLPEIGQHRGIYEPDLGMAAGYHLIHQQTTCGTGPGPIEADPATTDLALVLGGPLMPTCP
jgi:hypothetical protein